MTFDPSAFLRRRRAQLAAVSIALGSLMLAGPAVSQDQVQRVAKIGPVSSESGGTERVFFGRVVARETVDLAFQVGGQILQLPAEEGVTLPKGTLVAQLDLEPFELSLEEAEATRLQADRTLERFRRLEGSAVSPVAVEDAETDATLSAVAVKDAERSLRLATLTAPFDALVASRSVSNFSTISAGTPVVRLHDMSDLRIEIDVPELLFQRAGTDPNVEIFADFPASDERFPLELREFNAETTAVGQTFTITLGMAPPEGLVILPGSSVTVHTRLFDGQTSIIIPASALIFGNDGSAAVMVFEPTGAEEGSVRRVAVETVPNNFGMVTVASGLSADQEIVLSGAALLEDGEAVTRFSGFSN